MPQIELMSPSETLRQTVGGGEGGGVKKGGRVKRVRGGEKVGG